MIFESHFDLLWLTFFCFGKVRGLNEILDEIFHEDQIYWEQRWLYDKNYHQFFGKFLLDYNDSDEISKLKLFKQACQFLFDTWRKYQKQYFGIIGKVLTLFYLCSNRFLFVDPRYRNLPIGTHLRR